MADFEIKGSEVKAAVEAFRKRRRAPKRTKTPKPKTSRRDAALAELFLQTKAAGLPEFEREIIFHPTRKWRIDFGLVDLKIGIEFEGGIFAIGKPCPVCKRPPMGGHTRGKHYESDCQKYAEASLHGWIVIKATENLIKNGITIDQITRAYRIRTTEVVSEPVNPKGKLSTD